MMPKEGGIKVKRAGGITRFWQFYGYTVCTAVCTIHVHSPSVARLLKIVKILGNLGVIIYRQWRK
ncbi:MAG: hypothetical protein JSS12_09550 [Verrucomicrobia bacterium]|nr:hypothetical protein [Verrucomicrobiota bacterium]